jgi:hypothetical protein
VAAADADAGADVFVAEDVAAAGTVAWAWVLAVAAGGAADGVAFSDEHENARSKTTIRIVKIIRTGFLACKLISTSSSTPLQILKDYF